MYAKEAIALAAVAISLISLAQSYLNKKNEDVKDLQKEVQVLKLDLMRMQTRFDYAWEIIERRAGDILHKPIHFERDRWIERHQAGELSPEEREEFIRILDRIICDNDEAPGDRAAALLMYTAVSLRKLSENQQTNTAGEGCH